MEIIIKVSEQDEDTVMAVGAKDLLEHFLPQMGINADSVHVHAIDDENRARRLKGETYIEYRDNFPK